MKILTQTLLASSLTAALWLTPAGAETPAAVDNSGATPLNSSAPMPPGAASVTPSVTEGTASATPGTDSAQAPASETPSAAPAGNSAASATPGTDSAQAPVSETPSATPSVAPATGAAQPSASDAPSAAPVNSAAPASGAVSSATPPSASPGDTSGEAPAAPQNPAATGDAAVPTTHSGAVTQDSSALSAVPLPQGLSSADPALEAAASALPYAPGQATAPAADAPLPVMAAINQPISSTLSVAQMGQTRGITLTGGQLQSGITFTLPSDEVITNARLNLSLRVSAALAARNTSLQLMLNGQPLGTLPLGATDSDVSDYELEIPAAMVVSENNLSFKINDADKLLCEKESAQQYQVTILPQTSLHLEGQQLNIGTRLRNFPRPFLDPQRMTAATVTIGFASNLSPDAVSAAALVASWLGIQSDYRGIRFPVVRGELPENNGILFGHPGERIGTLTFPASNGPMLQLVDNPINPVYKLLLVSGNNADQLRQAANRLTQPLATDESQLPVSSPLPDSRKPYDAPRWINTDRPVRLSELLRKDQSLTSSGIWHDALRVNFRAAPDLFLWDGDTVPVNLHYRFPSETWIDEENSFLNVMLNGTFLRNLTVNKVGLLENAWHRLGGDARQEQYRLNLEPYLIYGDNQLALYFNIKPRADAPCGVLLNNNIKSRIEEDSWIDLSHTRHFSMLPNLSYFVGASFPFSRLADFGQTTLLLPETPSNAELSTLLDLAARAGNATGVALTQNQVMFGLPAGGTHLARLQQSDLLAVSTTGNSAFNQAMLAASPYDASGNTFGVKEPDTLEQLRGWLTGDWSRQQLDADRYFSSNEAWRGFLSYRSPWNPDRLVVMTVATSDDQLLRLHNDLSSAQINAAVRGDTAIITDENGIRSFRVGAQFPSGEMPWYMMVVWYANQHSVLLALAALLVSALVGSAAWAMLKRHAWRRLHPKQDRDSGRK
ncbi:cellulose biosynthesis cyclic di-GMP-binding regulatory protein BcsB [Pantoea anthophila]|uniref:cellulose biosynthesis cyclic di-GMP-binding regulatory protein BcsB n=1 Tax=Pantoea anthophila TaxID=470931 RepID=UPI002DB5E867|nr:cellulose biosynthesis cyclic di-GMP-binding regulatory protein BcsB [Pantoea anthophila]MEB5706991.1 cellulose biosynthesis cyclic di-GMP-binding regulatory protein BcsB [Pantoea anthophila]MEB6517826.1 cellulose biosynthesis cyclic di-GMP-binding regulatory protein BcsB [Pantoea anthophila]